MHLKMTEHRDGGAPAVRRFRGGRMVGVQLWLMAAACIPVQGGRASAADVLSGVQQLWVNTLDAENNGNYDKAIEYNNEILKQSGDYYLPNLRAAWLLYCKGEYKAAVLQYEKAAQLSPGAISALQGLVVCYGELGDVEKAIRSAKAMLILDPMNYFANLRLAQLAFAAADYDVASSYYQKLLTLYPEDLTVADGLAWCHLRRGLRQEAVALFRNVLVVSPNHVSSRAGLVESLAEFAKNGKER